MVRLLRSLFKMVPTCFTECVEFNFFSYNWICGSVCLKIKKGGGGVGGASISHTLYNKLCMPKNYLRMLHKSRHYAHCSD